MIHIYCNRRVKQWFIDTTGLAGLRRRRVRNDQQGAGEEEEEEEHEYVCFSQRIWLDITYCSGPLTKKQMQKEQKRQEREELRRFDELKREEMKKKSLAKDELYRLKLEERAEMERLEEEEEERLRLEQEKKEQDEFEQWKDMFSTEEQGSKVNEMTNESKELLQEFVDYIKQHKVVVLEDLAAEFQLPTQEAVKRVETLQEMNRLTGIVDDRGKFIYITTEEMQRVANYIQKKGRITLTDLAAESNRFIKLK